MTTIDDVAKKLSGQMFYLYDRWSDEKEYEDFHDYQDAMRKHCRAEGAEFLKLSKSPFQCEFNFDGKWNALKITNRGRGCVHLTKKADNLALQPKDAVQ